MSGRHPTARFGRMGGRKFVLDCMASALLLIGWMGLIFFMSAQPADQSSQMSMSTGLWVGRLLMKGFMGWPESSRMAFAAGIEGFVRKSAHAFEYAVLGGLLLNGIRCVQNVRRMDRQGCLMGGLTIVRRAAFAWLLGTVYAVTDELHQMMVPGRSGQVGDVVLDSVGVAFGVALFQICLWCANRCLSRRGDGNQG